MVWLCARDPSFLDKFLVLVDTFHYSGGGKKEPHQRCATSACASSYRDQLKKNHSSAEQHNAKTSHLEAAMPYLIQSHLSEFSEKAPLVYVCALLCLALLINLYGISWCMLCAVDTLEFFFKQDNDLVRAKRQRATFKEGKEPPRPRWRAWVVDGKAVAHISKLSFYMREWTEAGDRLRRQGNPNKLKQKVMIHGTQHQVELRRLLHNSQHKFSACKFTKATRELFKHVNYHRKALRWILRVEVCVTRFLST